jgi:hypothetical protein
LPSGKYLREELFRVTSLAQAEALLEQYRARHELVAA